MKHTMTLFKRELSGYFQTPVAYVFIVIFLLLSGFFTFQVGRLFEAGQASLDSFFTWHPWLYLFLIPAISMRLWAEERRSGTIELLMTLPITMSQAILGKFLAAWAFTGIALLGTFPIWITVYNLGSPDNGAILASYLGSFLMAGSFLAIGSAVSGITKNQVIAFVISVVLCLVFLLIGLPPVTGWMQGILPAFLVDTIASFSFFTHFDTIQRGLLQATDLVFFGSTIVFFLFLNGLILEARKAQ
ncbi:MAG TPA: ABC transporter permease [Planctomycetes bacterium]|nr:ABC transporter permease [Planctomycetota bacterium]